MVDLSVLLDIVQRRQPFYSASAAALSRAITPPNTAFLPAHAVTTPPLPHLQTCGTRASGYPRGLASGKVAFANQGHAQFVRARSLHFADFEDAAVASTAESENCEVILTRNLVDFVASPIGALTPEEFLVDL